MDKELLKKIKNDLPNGALSEIATKADTSYVTVLNFFKGTSTNTKVLKAVNEVYTSYKKNVNELTAMAVA